VNLKWVGLVSALILFCLMLWYIYFRPFPSAPPIIIDHAEKISVDELVDKDIEVGNIILPTWMPDEAQLVEILLFGKTAILVYGERDLVIKEEEDLLDAKATISIKPTRTILFHGAGAIYTKKEDILVGNLSVVIILGNIPGQPMWRKRITANFHRDGFRYYINVNKWETSKKELIRIIENMEPVGSGTLRKTDN
jgi:hypothetical protein